MLTIRCSGEPPEIELVATSAEFERLAVSITALVASDAAEMLVEAATSSPDPYERCLKALRIVKSAPPLSVSVADAVLSITGHPSGLVLFAGDLPVESALPASYHVHFEVTGREGVLSADSR